jgi:hypothetical protein
MQKEVSMTDFSEAYKELMYRLYKLQDRIDMAWYGEYRVYLSQGTVGFDIYRNGTYQCTLPELGDVEYELLDKHLVDDEYSSAPNS